MPTRKPLLVWVALLAAACLCEIAPSAQSGRTVPLSQTSTSDYALRDSLENALEQITKRRRTDRSTDIECSAYFASFNRYREIEPYILFFQSIGISANFADLNGKYYVSFGFTYSKLAEMGFGNFFRNDYLVIVFTTGSKSSIQISSFKSNLLSGGYI